MANDLSPRSPTPLTALRPRTPLAGRIRVPGDKSISHRALMLGALAVGRTEIRGLLEGEDVLATAAALNALGAHASPDANGRRGGGRWMVDGIGIGGLVEPDDLLDLGNSGTAARLLLGILATHPITTFVTGDASLRRRPMGRVDRALEPFRRPLCDTGRRSPAARRQRRREPGADRLSPSGGLGAGQIRGAARRAQHPGGDHGDRAPADPRPHRAHAAPFRRDGRNRARRRAAGSASPSRATRSSLQRRLPCRATPPRPRSR